MTKACARCGESKPVESFYVRKRDGQPTSYCKGCSSAYAREWNAKNRERRREYARQWTAANPDRVRASKRKTTYGITDAGYARMREKQNGCCAACSDTLQGGRREAIDHDHESGVVRGILCCWCNKALGHAKEDPRRLHALAAYASQWKGVMQVDGFVQ